MRTALACLFAALFCAGARAETRFARYEKRGAYTVEVPKAPWTMEQDLGSDATFFLAPPRRDGLARGALKIQRFPGVFRGSKDVVDEDDGAGSRTRSKAIQRKGYYYVVGWRSPRKTFDEGVPVFERALKTLRFKKP